ncbi:MAG: hypothetical protein F4112_15985 [Holophagales bacterium]|nr:hypothetical protein [Holophagales bacterium]MYB20860.1 hypothetical protein [Holophagales bacterium]MYH25500.1 hypothetical protein [Holophagales bacterium]MYI34448.1 hypothetical protein [Holophagales bacterium]
MPADVSSPVDRGGGRPDHEGRPRVPERGRRRLGRERLRSRRRAARVQRRNAGDARGHPLLRRVGPARVPPLHAGAAGKNLEAVARHWWRGSSGRDEVEEAAEALGIRIEGSLPEENEHCAVLACNWDAVRAFLASDTQWRFAPSGRLAGLDYLAARAAVRAISADGLGLEKRGRRLRWRRVFDGLRTMEAEVLKQVRAASPSPPVSDPRV